MCVYIYVHNQNFEPTPSYILNTLYFIKRKCSQNFFIFKRNTVKLLPAILELAYKTIEKGQVHTAQMYIWSCSISHSDTLGIHV